MVSQIDSPMRLIGAKDSAMSIRLLQNILNENPIEVEIENRLKLHLLEQDRRILPEQIAISLRNR